MQLQKRGIIPCPAMQAFNPLWFVAETERNVFLWRRGCSLIQQDEFEFWIDLPKLIDKRLHQLASQNDSPFVNPLWGISVLDKDSAKREQDYVRAFAEIQERISGHMNALSHIGSLLIRELVSAGDREVVVLPASPARAAGALPDAACQR